MSFLFDTMTMKRSHAFYGNNLQVLKKPSCSLNPPLLHSSMWKKKHRTSILKKLDPSYLLHMVSFFNAMEPLSFANKKINEYLTSQIIGMRHKSKKKERRFVGGAFKLREITHFQLAFHSGNLDCSIFDQVSCRWQLTYSMNSKSNRNVKRVYIESIQWWHHVHWKPQGSLATIL